MAITDQKKVTNGLCRATNGRKWLTWAKDRVKWAPVDYKCANVKRKRVAQLGVCASTLKHLRTASTNYEQQWQEIVSGL